MMYRYTIDIPEPKAKRMKDQPMELIIHRIDFAGGYCVSYDLESWCEQYIFETNQRLDLRKNICDGGTNAYIRFFNKDKTRSEEVNITDNLKEIEICEEKDSPF